MRLTIFATILLCAGPVQGRPAGLIDAGACKRYAENAQRQLERRLQQDSARRQDALGGALSVALRHVLRRDSIFCAARSCDPVAVVVSRADSAALPAGGMPRLLPVTDASLKDVGPVLRAVTVSTEASGDVLVVRIDDLSERAPPAGLTPAIPIGGSRFYRAGHGWSIGVTRKAGAWVVTSVTEWIT